MTLPGAIPDGAQVPISADGHGTTRRGELPVGMATIHTSPTEARADGEFFLTTTAGRDTFEVVKELGELGQWSCGLTVLESRPVRHVSGRHVRLLDRVAVHEVSPVLLVAGVGTRTIAAKQDPDLVAEHLRFVAWRVGRWQADQRRARADVMEAHADFLRRSA